MKEKKGALEISFGWLFALIAGIVIIFLAIYFSSKLINSGQETVSAKTGKEIDALLNPLETSYETAQTTSITIPTETRIHNICDSAGNFGKQGIQLEQKSFNKWVKTDVNIFFENKYIFSDNETEGKTFYIFSKPFDFPFKIADLIYMTSSKKSYCFVDAPEEISQEIFNLNQSNLLIDNCAQNGIRICFNNENCDINVDLSSESVEKDGKIMYFAETGEGTSALMYAAIFSDKDAYECQIKRLMLRLEEISLLYKDKGMLIQKEGCDNNAGGSLDELSQLAGDLTSSSELGIVKTEADAITEINNAGDCLLW
ncbi:Uncharacterised protein [uncultured archaeon]|nr:Uncharacterised protein [uncultured archaeon]